MGYDFSFVKIGPRSSFDFPCSVMDVPGGPVEINWPAMCKCLKSLGTKGPKDGPLMMMLGDHEMLGFFGLKTGIAVDVHAQWSAVLAIYRELLKLEPDLVVLDEQSGCFYDDSSFKRLVAEK